MLLSPSLSASGKAANLGKVLRLPVHLCGNTTCAVVAHQDDHAAVNLANQPLEGVIRDIGRGTRPPHDQPPLIEQQAEFAADNPPMVGEPFAADLLGAAAFADGVNELDAIRVDDAEHGRRGQENPRPVLMGLEETKEPGALGEVGKQRPIVARQPAIERPVPDALVGRRKARYLTARLLTPPV
jgi:hypothetical protein